MCLEKGLTRVYKTIVLPFLDYCSCIWDPPHGTHIKKLERVQNFAARIVKNVWSIPADVLLLELKCPSLVQRRQYQKLCLCYRILQGYSILPSTFFQRHKNSSTLFRPYVRTLHHLFRPYVRTLHHLFRPYVRTLHHLFRPYVRTLHHRSSFQLSSVDVWNKIPDSITSVSSNLAFKRHLKNFFILNYFCCSVSVSDCSVYVNYGQPLE